MNARGVVVVLALCVFTGTVPALYAADGWWPDFSGGKSTGTSAATKQGAATKQSGATKKSSTSAWWPWSSSKPKSPSRSSKPSTLNKVTESTKSAWNKTVTFLNPFDNPPAEKSTPSSRPNTGNWFPSRKPEDKPNSVPEWMKGEMPTF